jgi:hypothetical protein
MLHRSPAQADKAASGEMGMGMNENRLSGLQFNAIAAEQLDFNSPGMDHQKVEVRPDTRADMMAGVELTHAVIVEAEHRAVVRNGKSFRQLGQ